MAPAFPIAAPAAPLTAPAPTYPPFDPTNPIVYSRDRMYTALATGAIAATATGATHYGLTVLYTIRQLRTAIDSFRKAGVDLLGAVNASTMMQSEKESIKTNYQAIKTNLIALVDKIDSAKERKSQLALIKVNLEAIKTALAGQLTSEYTMAWQTYSSVESASDSASMESILQQAFAAGLVIGVAAGLGSNYAEEVQDAITLYVGNLFSGPGAKK